MRSSSVVLRLLLLATLPLFLLPPAGAQDDSPAKLEPAELGKTANVHSCGGLFLSGQFTREDIELIKKRGIERIVTLRADGEVAWDEKAAVEGAGLEFRSVPFRAPEALTDDVFDEVRKLLRSPGDKTLLHCGSANRVGGVWLPYRVLDEGVPLEVALEEARKIGLRSADIEARALAYIEAQSKKDSSEESVRPGINDSFLDPALDIDRFLERFEGESREIFAARAAVIAACGIAPGQRVADIGAGTGLYTRLFSKAVGDSGWVYAVDISPRFIGYVREGLREQGIRNVSPVLCQEDSINLAPESIDLAFVCDTYHHFEYPRSTLASIHRALKSGGTLIVIDFERIPGKSRDWLIEHVRAGKEVFRAEIEEAGFDFAGELEIEGLEENYALRFQKS